MNEIDDDIILTNAEEADDLIIKDLSGILMFSRDWTVATIFDQIKEGNIELNPRFQRRNAWKDARRSQLIESMIIGYPIPEIVLAQDPNDRGKFIVIDGKQRLLTIAGFFDNSSFKYWDREQIRDLKVRSDLNGYSFESLPQTDLRCLKNASLRCSVISNFSDSQILYDIFYRLNAGTVQLATQELRQVLNKGPFADFLFDYTDSPNPIRDILGLLEPDARMRDIEVMLRLIAFLLYPQDYRGNLKVFLDKKMHDITVNWACEKSKIETIKDNIESAINHLYRIFGDYKKIAQRHAVDIGRKKFNRVLLEVLVYYFSQIKRTLTDQEKEIFLDKYKNLSETDEDFQRSLDTTTKSMENYVIRYSRFQQLMSESFQGIQFSNPFKMK